MSQVVFSTPIDTADSGTDLATALNAFKAAIMSGFSGTSRPAETEAGGYWIDTTNDPTSWSYMLYTGTVDVEIFKLNLDTGAATVSLAADDFTIRKVSDTSVGAILELVKRRIATNGQVASGDVVGEVRFVGRTDTSTDPVVAKLIFTAGETQTDTSFGGTFSLQSTPQGTATLIEHMKFAAGIIESVVAHKMESQILVSQSVATTSTIVQLSATKVVVEMTGSTATDIQGVNSGHVSKVVTIHNRSTANITLKHQDLTAAAADRLILPESEDIVLFPEEAATLIYSDADTRWKLKDKSARFEGFQVDNVFPGGSWTAPSGVTTVRVYAYPEFSLKDKISHLFYSSQNDVSSYAADENGILYAWGGNTVGQLGVGNVTPRSSPIAVLSNLNVKKIQYSRFITPSGVMFAWGENNKGQLGVGNTTDRSSPVAVVGSRLFSDFYVVEKADGESVLAIEKDTGDLYAWGTNLKGQLGVGDAVARSSPVAVLGGLDFRAVGGSKSSSSTQAFSLGLTTAGVLYAWGANGFGQLGVGDLVARSSPVAVLGGLTVRKFLGTASAVRVLTEDGDIYAWGVNSWGELGIGNTTTTSTPTLVLGGIKFVDFNDSDTDSTFAISVDGDGYAWGLNSSAHLGVGDFTERSSPVLILGGLKYKKINCSNGCSFGLTVDGILYAWGDNSFGTLGLGDTSIRSSPVQVLGGLKFRDFILEDASIWAVTEEGILYAWGVNDNGQLGLGDVTPRSSPVQVLGGLKFGLMKRGDNIFSMTVVPTTTYNLSLTDGRMLFGTYEVPANTRYIEVEYL